MKKARLVGPLILFSLPAAVFLQATLLANSLPGQVTPNLAFLLTVAAGYQLGAAGGASAGLWGGALMGAASGAMAVPLSCLYGLVGWLAGLHAEKEPRSWTFPVAGMALGALLISGGSALSSILEGSQPALFWKLMNLAYLSFGSLAFLAFPIHQKRGSKDQ